MPITVSIVEDSDQLRNTLARVLNRADGFECVSTYANAEAALEDLPRNKDGDPKVPNGAYFNEGGIERNDPILVRVVEEMGAGHRSGASGQYASLKVVEIPDGVEWEIDEYDGQEHIAQKHATWG